MRAASPGRAGHTALHLGIALDHPLCPRPRYYSDVRFLLFLAIFPLLAQQSQNPSPMVEHTRQHPRLPQSTPPGRRVKLELGTLFIPARLAQRSQVPLVIHFHGGAAVPEVAAARYGRAAIVAIQLGSGSATYAKPFQDPQRFARLLDEAQKASGVRFSEIVLSGWSAGYGAIRAILMQPENYARVSRVLLIDGLHTGYVDGKPGPQESRIDPEPLEVFLRFARDAVAGRKRMLVTHSEIFPGTFASTTETTDYLVAQLKLRRRAVVKWGPMGTQQLSEVRQGGFRILGFAGNSAPDHVDQLHSLASYLRLK
jgi:hypothetical protein